MRYRQRSEVDDRGAISATFSMTVGTGAGAAPVADPNCTGYGVGALVDPRSASDEGGTGAIIGGTGDRACATAGLPLAEEY